MKTIGDKVTISAKYSTFDRMTGVVTEVIDQTKEYTVFPYTVKFDDGTPQGDECCFAEDEILEDK